MRLKITIGVILLRQLVSEPREPGRRPSLFCFFVFLHYLHAAIDAGADGHPVGLIFQLDIILHRTFGSHFRYPEDLLLGIFFLQPAEDRYRQVLLRIITQRAEEVPVFIVFHFGEDLALAEIDGVLFSLFRPDYLLGIRKGLFECLQQLVADVILFCCEGPGREDKHTEDHEERFGNGLIRCHNILI
jgi:hypothetical protein